MFKSTQSLHAVIALIYKGDTMFVKTLECSYCGAHHSYKEIHTVCKKCGNVLLVKYDLDAVTDTLRKNHFSGRSTDLWRYTELLPVGKKNIITLGEGYTPVLPSRTYRNLLIKDESLNPTGTFKARGLAVAVSKAHEFGITDIVMPSAGNAGAALSFYCARAGITAHVYMPEDAPEVTKRECNAAGADVHFVKGTIQDAGVSARTEGEPHWFDMSTLKEPYRLEGKKTMGLEIAEYFNWKAPDVVIYPTGGGTGLIGIWKAFQELEKMGWVTDKPKMVTVQSSGCAPIVKAFKEKKETSELWKTPETIAAGLNVPHPFAHRLILKTLRESGGTAVTVTDEEIVQAVADLARTEGVYACPEGAATFAAFKNLLHAGDLSEDENVVLINTGSGLIYPF